MSEPHLVRIRPTSPRETQVIAGRTFRKERGWYGPIDDFELLETLREEVENELNPASSQRVFQVCTLGEAKKIDAKERRWEEPRGTVERPAGPPEEQKPIQASRAQRVHRPDVDPSDPVKEAKNINERARKARAQAEGAEGAKDDGKKDESAAQ